MKMKKTALAALAFCLCVIAMMAMSAQVFAAEQDDPIKITDPAVAGTELNVEVLQAEGEGEEAVPVSFAWAGPYDDQSEMVFEPDSRAVLWTPKYAGDYQLTVTFADEQQIAQALTVSGTVKFDAAGGKVGKDKVVHQYLAPGKKLGKLTEPYQKDHKFLGWFTKKKGGKKINAKTKANFGEKQSVTYYAHWDLQVEKSPIIKYKGKNATRVPVITYHRISSAKEKSRRYCRGSLFISEGKFKQQMKWLHDHGYYTLSMEEFYLWHQGKIKVPKKSVVITFDDGMYSIIKYGYPVLKKYHMKATMFMIGWNVARKTNKSVTGNGTYHTTGRDVIKQVTKEYPDFEFQSHTWGLHVRAKGGNGYARTKSYLYQKRDFKKMYEKFGYEFLAYPFGHYTKKTIRAAKAGHIKMAFTYGQNTWATKSQSKYAIKRIKIDGNDGMKRFTRWF